MYRRLDVQTLMRTDVSISVVWTLRQTDILMCRDADVSNVQLFTCVDAQMFRWAHINTYKCMDVLHVLTYRCLDVQIF